MKKLFTALILTVLASYASAATYTVDDDGPADFNSIQAAIDFVNDNDVIIVYQGTYYEHIIIQSKSITLRSDNPDDPCIITATIIDGNDILRCINATSFNGPNAVISGFTIRNGNAPDGAGIRLIQSSGSVADCKFINNKAGDVGGAMRCTSAVTIQNCNFTENSAESGGAIYLQQSDSIIIDCNFIQNTSIHSGGAIYCHDSDPNLSRCNFINNSTGNGGGIASLYGSNPTITDCNFLANTAGEDGFLGWGGGLYCDAFDTNTIVANCTFTDNWAAESGGGVCFFEGSNSKMTGCTFTENSAERYGGGAYCYDNSDNTFESCSFSKNSAGGGGAICFEDDIYGIVQYCNFSENHADDFGGAIWCYRSSDPIIENCAFTRNSAGSGGAIYCRDQSSPTIINCMFIANLAGTGGGIFNSSAKSTLINCTLSKNSALFRGGGAADFESQTNVANSVFWANIAPDGNEIALTNTIIDFVYCDIKGGQSAIDKFGNNNINWGPGNIDIDPCFVEPGYWDTNSTPTDANDDFWVDGDYHLKSQGWRWDSERQRWDWDNVTSRCIDAGNPGSSLADEPNVVDEWTAQNLRINMGAFGGTAEASMPPYDWALLCDIDNSGIVDLKDFAWLSMLWLNQDEELFADFNRDLNVDSNDLGLLAEDYLKTTTWN